MATRREGGRRSPTLSQAAAHDGDHHESREIAEDKWTSVKVEYELSKFREKSAKETTVAGQLRSFEEMVNKLKAQEDEVAQAEEQDAEDQAQHVKIGASLFSVVEALKRNQDKMDSEYKENVKKANKKTEAMWNKMQCYAQHLMTYRLPGGTEEFTTVRTAAWKQICEMLEDQTENPPANDAQIEELTSNMAEKDELIKTLQKELKKQAAEKDTEIGTLKGKVTERDSKVSNMKNQAIQKDSQIEKLQYDFQVLVYRAEHLKNTIAELKAGPSQDLQSKLDRTTGLLTEADGLVKSNAVARDQYNKLLDEAKKMNTELENAKATTEGQLRAANARVAELETERTQVDAAKSRAETSLGVANEKVAELEGQLGTTRSKVTELESAKSTIQTDLNDAETEKTRLKNELEAAEDRINGLKEASITDNTILSNVSSLALSHLPQLDVEEGAIEDVISAIYLSYSVVLDSLDDSTPGNTTVLTTQGDGVRKEYMKELVQLVQELIAEVGEQMEEMVNDIADLLAQRARLMRALNRQRERLREARHGTE